MTQDDSMLSVESGAELPTKSQPASCCRWRSTLQVPFLLFAAAGLGFSGQQLWQNEGDIAALLGGSNEAACASTSCCSQSASCMTTTAPSACCAEAALALARSAEQDQAADAAVSALSPQNVSMPSSTETAVF